MVLAKINGHPRIGKFIRKKNKSWLTLASILMVQTM